MKQHIRIDFSDFWHPNTLEAKLANPIYKLLSTRFDIEICDNPDFMLFSGFGPNFVRHRGVRIYYTGENRRPNYALCDWAFGCDYSDDARFMRWPFYSLQQLQTGDYKNLTAPRNAVALLQQKTRFCAFIASNGSARERLRFLEMLSRYKAVDCGGKVRNNLGYLVDDKINFLNAYKFNIAFENSSFPGYTTEKLPDALAGNTVPIYWGNPLVAREFNPAAFVNCHDFPNLEAVVEFIVELDRNDDLYLKYLGAPPFVDGRFNEFLDNDRVLDRFELIFNTPISRPVARTMRGTVQSMLRQPKRLRNALVARKASV